VGVARPFDPGLVESLRGPEDFKYAELRRLLRTLLLASAVAIVLSAGLLVVVKRSLPRCTWSCRTPSASAG